MIDPTLVTYVGPSLEEQPSFSRNLPADYKAFLSEWNGCILYDGGLHIRGVYRDPQWHSLENVWTGSDALSTLFTSVLPDDLPFGQDACGDQFLLRDGLVIRLLAETDELVPLGLDFKGFLQTVQNDPLNSLLLHPLIQFGKEGGSLQPGELLSVYPPFCTAESRQGVSLRAISALGRLRFLASFAAQINGKSSA